MLISTASLLGVYFTGRTHGLTGLPLFWRWLALIAPALVVGFLTWRLFYLRQSERGLSAEKVGALHEALLGRVRFVAPFLSVLLVLGATVPFVVGYFPGQSGTLLSLSFLAAAALLPFAWRSKAAALISLLLTAGTLVLFSVIDSGGLFHLTLTRGVHLLAFGLWLGGALFNLGAAVPAGRRHANTHAVVAGARQLERFRWVVRFSLPTIIITGVMMALRYGGINSTFWRSGLGLIVPAKLGLIALLVVIFITCPLYRACSPVRGVCDLSDLDE